MTEFNWVNKNDSPIRTSTFLMSHGVTRTLLKKVKYHGGIVLVNGIDRHVNYQLTKGDSVKMILPKEPSNEHVIPSDTAIEIAYEDDNFLVVNKPAKVATVPSHIYSTDSLANRVKGYYLKQNYENLKIHVVTRLDRDTSGLVIFAKHHLAHSVLDKQLKDHQIKKTYLAIASGKIATNHGEIYLPIGREENSFIKRKIATDGKMADTEFWNYLTLNNSTLIKVRLHTGRTHQIRVHMQAIGHPLIGDWLYNEHNHQMTRQALHCFQIKFYDPFNEKWIECIAKLPNDMKLFVQND